MEMSQSAENYLKTILLLKKKLGSVRSIDIANELMVSKPSVSNALKKLRNKGLLVVDLKRNIIMTEAGLKYATSIYEHHIWIERFLTDFFKIDSETAHTDACRMEHLLSDETFVKLKEYYDEKLDSEN